MMTIQLQASELRLQSMGLLTYSVPDIDVKMNLYQIAGNNAGLILNDSSNWMNYSTKASNYWGSLRRHWDAFSQQNYNLSFSGLKHLGVYQAFWGEIKYKWDYREKVNNAIEPHPYALDPFVLADYTEGNFLYHGPEVSAVYNYLISDKISFGSGIKYYIGRGLKNRETEPEIISRKISASIDLMYTFSEQYRIGLSFIPFNYFDDTKLVEQKDGKNPVIRLYRGEFIYKERVSKNNRNAKYTGYDLRPQFSFKNELFSNVTYFNFYYQWLNVSDIVASKQITDGYFQAQHYSFNTVNRIRISNEYKTHIFLNYKYENYTDWAKLQNPGLLFFQSKGNLHEISIGGSYKINNLPLIIAGEIFLNMLHQNKSDYIVSKTREGEIISSMFKSGIEYLLQENFKVRLGFIWLKYREDSIWNYYGDYSGSGFTLGTSFSFNDFEIESFGKYLYLSGVNRNKSDLNIIFSLKQHF